MLPSISKSDGEPKVANRKHKVPFGLSIVDHCTNITDSVKEDLIPLKIKKGSLYGKENKIQSFIVNCQYYTLTPLNPTHGTPNITPNP